MENVNIKEILTNAGIANAEIKKLVDDLLLELALNEFGTIMERRIRATESKEKLMIFAEAFLMGTVFAESVVC